MTSPLVVSSRSSVLLWAAAGMCATILLSNIAVSFPLHELSLEDYLTWGAISYPFVFLVTDLTNRRLGMRAAYRVVWTGFVAGIALSVYFASPRIALASGMAFLTGQFLDVQVFDLLRWRRWWVAPLISSAVGGLLDTAVFFSVAFADVFSCIAQSDPFAIGETVVLGMADGALVPRWVNWAICDLMVKLAMSTLLLIPYRVISAHLFLRESWV